MKPLLWRLEERQILAGHAYRVTGFEIFTNRTAGLYALATMARHYPELGPDGGHRAVLVEIGKGEHR